MKSSRKLAILAIIGLAICQASLLHSQTLWLTASSSSTWLTPGNWTGGIVPSNTTAIAQFGANPTSGTTPIAINMNTVAGQLQLGAVEVTSARSSLNLTIGNSSTTVAGNLTMYGATVNAVANTILRNGGAGTTTLIITNGSSSTGFPMGLSNNLASAVIDASAPIFIYSIMSGNGFTKTGASTLTLFAANLYTGSTTLSSGTLIIGNDTATLGSGAGTLVLAGGTFFRAGQTTAQTFANPISMTADSAIVGNPTTGSRTIPFNSSSVSGSAGTLTVSNSAVSGSGLLQVRFSGSFTFSRPVIVAKAFSGSGIMLQFYNSAATGDQTWSGLILGNGTLYKNVSSGAGGNVILSSGNGYTGGTEIRGGFFGLGADNALGFGGVTIGFDSNPLGLFANGAARQLTNDIFADTSIANSTNLQIKGSQDLTLSGRIVITNLMQFTISNTALTTFSGNITNVGAAGGIIKQGPGKLILTGTNTFIGTTTVGAGTLALTGNGSINNSTNVTIFGGSVLDLSGLNSTLTLSNSQTLRGVSTNGATGTIILSGTAGLTLSSNSPLVLIYLNGTPVLTVTNGVLTLNSNNPAAITTANGGAGLPVGDYKLISITNAGFVTGSAPTNVTVNGDGLAGGSASLVISNSELYLRVNVAATPPLAPVANAASSTNVTGFTASWNSATGAAGYRLDVSLANDFSSFVSGYNNLDVGAVTSFAVTGLNPNTTYYYQVRATNAFGTSPSSSPAIAVTTLVAPYVWNTGSGYWSVPGSWQYANVPVNGAAPGFIGGGGNSTNDLASLLLNSLTFSNGAGPYVISGNALVISNGILNSSTASETISAPLTLGAAETFNAAAGPLTFTGPITNAGNALTANAAANITNSGSLSGSGALLKTGAGTLLLSGANTFTGATTNNAGTLEVAGGSALPDAATLSLANTAGVTLTLDANETVGSISGGDNSTISLGANNLSAGGDGTSTTLTSAITGAGKLVKTGVGTLTLNKTTAYGSSFVLRTEGGTTDINRAGNSLLGIFGSGNRIELAGGTLQISGSAQANFGFAAGGLDIYSDSTIFFNRTTSSSSQSPTNSSPLNFKGNAILSFGYANVSGGTTLFDGASNTLQGNATLALGAYGITIASPIGESGGSYSLTKTGAGQLNLNAINTYSGPTTNLQGVIQVNGTSTFGNGSGTLVLAGGDILDANTRAGAPIANPILMTANTTISGNGTLTDGSFRYFPLSNNSITTIGGTLTVRNAAASGINEFRLRFTGGGFNFSQPIIVGSSLDVSTLTTALHIYNDTNVPAQTFSGNISGTGSIVKSAPIAASGGVTILSGSNSYAGGTIVSEGLLLVNNTSGSGTGTNTVSLTSGGTLGGTGIILGVVTNSFGSILKPGLGGLDTSTLTISNNLGLAGTAFFTLNRTNAQNAAKVSGLSTVRYGGTLTLTNVGDALQSGDTFVLFSAAAYTGAFTNYILPALGANLAWATNNLALNGSVAVVSTITPTTLNLLSSLNPAGYLTPVNFTGTVDPTNATGTLSFFTNGVALSTSNLVLGSASSPNVILPRGTNLITAIYSGDLNYSPSTNTLNQIVTNHVPVANGTTYTRNGLNTWRVSVTDLLTNATDADSDGLTLDNVGTSTNGITLVVSGGYVQYYNTNIVDDQFTYTVTDGFGGTNSAIITLTAGSANGVGGQINNFTANGGTASMSFAGIPGYLYHVQVSTNLSNWDTIWTTNAPANGLFQFNDGNAPQPDAYYRLMWNGN